MAQHIASPPACANHLMATALHIAVRRYRAVGHSGSVVRGSGCFDANTDATHDHHSRHR
jgi:hypothetical protein